MVSYKDWVCEISQTVGTGAYQLAGAPAGTSYFTFRSQFSNGEIAIIYYVVNASRTKWEKNRFGTLTYGSPDTLTRNVVQSTNSDLAVPWVGSDLPLRIYIAPEANPQTLFTNRPIVKTANFTLALDDASIINNKTGSGIVMTLQGSTYGRHLIVQNNQAQTFTCATSSIIPKGGGAAGTAILPATSTAWAYLVGDGTGALYIIMMSGT